MPVDNLENVKKIFKKDISNILVVKTNVKFSNVPSTIYDYDNKQIIREGRVTKSSLFS